MKKYCFIESALTKCWKSIKIRGFTPREIHIFQWGTFYLKNVRVPTTPQSDYEGYRSSLTFTVKKGWLILISPNTKKNVYVVEWVACDILGPGWSLVKFLCPGRHDPDFWHILQCPEYFLLSWIGAWKYIVLDLYLGDHMHQIWLHLFILSGLMHL